MTVAQYKKMIRSMSRDELENHLFEMFSISKTFRDIESSFFSREENEKQLEQFRKKLDKTLWKRSFSLSECKGVLKEAVSRCVHQPTIARMHLSFALATARLTLYGDFGNSFYNALLKSAEEYLAFAKKDVDFFKEHEAEFEKIVETCRSIGYGVYDALVEMLDYARFEVYEEDDNEEGCLETGESCQPADWEHSLNRPEECP